MFDRIIDLLVQILTSLRPIAIIPQYEAGVILRFGRLHRPATTGLCFLWPLVEQLHKVSINAGTTTTPAQSITTASGASVVVSVAVTWYVSDPERFILAVDDGEAAVLDCLLGVIGDEVATAAPEATRDDVVRRIRKTANARARQWGIRFERVSLADYTKARTLRLIQLAETRPDQSEAE